MLFIGGKRTLAREVEQASCEPTAYDSRGEHHDRREEEVASVHKKFTHDTPRTLQLKGLMQIQVSEAQ